MNRRARLSPAAVDDLDGITLYLLDHAGVETAGRFEVAVRRTIEDVAVSPGIGERWDTDKTELAGLRVVRIEGFPRHLMYYSISSDEIVVVRILHGSRDLDTLLGP